MLIGELAERAKVSTKAVRYYERLGFVTPTRKANGYRDYDSAALRIVEEIRELAASGITPAQATAFVECLELGHEHSDDCVTSLVVYRDRIAELDTMIASLTRRRNDLACRLEASATRSTTSATRSTSSATRSTTKETIVDDFMQLPDDLPVPQDDGAAAHLTGMDMPDLTLRTSDDSEINLGDLGPGRTIVYLYPLTGVPGVDLPEGWDAIPGARGCSTEACDFRDHFSELAAVGASRVYGMSSQDIVYQTEVTDRLHLPFTMISDETFALADALRLPTFAAPGHDRLYARLTLVIRDGRIDHVFYPIFPPNTHAQQVLRWLHEHPIEP